MTRVAVVGAAGMLGRDLMRSLSERTDLLRPLSERSDSRPLSERTDSRPLSERSESKGPELDIVGFTRPDLDVTDPAAVRERLAGFDIIVNAAAWNRVDDAEQHEAEAFAVNADGPANLAVAAAASGARLIQLSTDYVFGGTATSPIPEDAPRHPLSAYGRSKAAGEQRALAAHPAGTAIVRTAWLYGAHGTSFPRTMLRLAGERETVSVVTDQLGQPTWTGDLAAQLVRLIGIGVPPGIYHGTNAGQVSWYGFARELFRLAGLDPERVLPTDSAAFVRPAPRPAYSVLGHAAWARVGLPPMRPWDEALAAAFAAGVFTAVLRDPDR